VRFGGQEQQTEQKTNTFNATFAKQLEFAETSGAIEVEVWAKGTSFFSYPKTMIGKRLPIGYFPTKLIFLSLILLFSRLTPFCCCVPCRLRHDTGGGSCKTQRAKQSDQDHNPTTCWFKREEGYHLFTCI
jgi:hypothetical protein